MANYIKESQMDPVDPWRRNKNRDPYLIGPHCQHCVYLGRIGAYRCCDYLIIEGHTRPDEPTAQCSVRVLKCKRPPPDGYYFTEDAARALGIAKGTLNTFMTRDGIHVEKKPGYGNHGLLSKSTVVQLARRHMHRVYAADALPEPLLELRRAVILALKE